MKTAIQLQQSKKCIIFFFTGLTCITMAYMIHIFKPTKIIVNYQLQMTPHTIAYRLWQKPPIDVYIKVYVFNITNPDEFLNGNTNLKLEEIGPFVYKEVLENTKVQWNQNGTLTYTPKRQVMFMPDMSIGDPHDYQVRVPNVPLLGVSSALYNAGFFVNYPITHLANFLDSKPILNITAHEFLWGYEDSLVSLASDIVPNFIDFKKFGLLDRMYDEGENVVTMNIVNNEDMIEETGRYMSIEKINGSPGLKQWGYVNYIGNESLPQNTKCNRIEGATEGVLFPPSLDKHAVFRVFRKAFCRTIPIEYVKDVSTDLGLPGFVYKIQDDFAEVPSVNPDNECYCRKLKTCLKRGLSDLTPCYYNIPAAVSLPHFLNSDPSLFNGIEGLQPDPEKHGSTIILQPQVGVPMFVNSRLQTNLVMYSTRYNSKITAFNDKVIPLFWTDLYIPSLSFEVMVLIRLVVQIFPALELISILIFVIVGLWAVGWSVFTTVIIAEKQQPQHHHQHEMEEISRRDSTDIRIPLGYGQFTTIRIIPAIKKITSKSELFS